MLAITRSTTPSFLTLAGGDIQIGSVNLRVAMSMGFSALMGMVLLDHCTDSSSTMLRLVQSMKLSVPCTSKLGLNKVSICSSSWSFWLVFEVQMSRLSVSL